MYRIGEKEFNDQEVGYAYWEKVKERMAWCRSKAEEYINLHARTANYRLDYDIASGLQSIYVDFTEKELDTIKTVIEQEVGENGLYYNEFTLEEAFNSLTEKMDVDFYNYIPDEHMHDVDGLPTIRFVDLNDVKFYSSLSILYLDPSYCDRKLCSKTKLQNISNEEYLDLLTAHLFDSRISFNDIRILLPELHDKISKNMYVPHLNYMICLSEIYEVAKEIMDSVSEEEKPFEICANAPFIPLIWDGILRDEEIRKTDAKLLQAFKLAIR